MSALIVVGVGVGAICLIALFNALESRIIRLEAQIRVIGEALIAKEIMPKASNPTTTDDETF